MAARWIPAAKPIALAGTSARPVDPLFAWAEHTKWRGFARHAAWDGRSISDNDKVQLLIRADSPAHARALMSPSGLLTVPPMYLPAAGVEPPLHFTATVQRRDLQHLAAGELDAEWQLSLPLRDAERVAQGSAIGRYGPSRSETNFRARNVLEKAVNRAPKGGSVARADQVIAVIDFGCPFLQERYLDGTRSKTRLLALWDQGSDLSCFDPPPDKVGDNEYQSALDERKAGWPWQKPRGTRYGRELRPPMLQAMVEAVRAKGSSIDEGEAYRGIDYLIDYDDPRRRVWQATHGAHVLDVAGGTLDPLTGSPDAASKANLVFVQLPAMTAADSAGGSLAGHVLDGVHYVLGRCAPGARAVISISYGNRGGPHDGSNFIETALDELLHRRGHDVAIVLAAGNSRRQASHARRIARHERSALFNLWLTPGDTTDSFVQFWYEPPPAGWTMRARVRSPDRQWSARVEPGQESLMRDDGIATEVVAMLRHEITTRRRLPERPLAAGSPLRLESYRRGLVLLATAPTAQPPGVPCALAAPGRWEIEIELVPIGPVPTGTPPQVAIDAWIERDDPGQTVGAGESRFLDQDSNDDRDTLSSLANGRHTIVAGGFRRGGGRPADYSSIGPRRRAGELPQVMALCEEDAVEPGIRAAAVRSVESYRMNGTSVAAPVLARRLFNWLATPGRKHPTSPADWRQALEDIIGQGDGAVRRLPED